MDTIKKIEDKLGAFFKDLPALPEASREALVKAWPMIALVFGVLQLAAAWFLWDVVRAAERSLEYSSFYVRDPYTLSGSERFMVYLGIAVLVLDALILLKAYPELKKRSRRGWSLLFLGALINVAYAVLSIFIQDRGFGSFAFSLLGSAVGFYLLYQVQGKYGFVKKSSKNKTT